MTQPIRDLVRAARTGDASAFATLMTRHEGASLGYAAALLRDEARARDAVQDAFLEAYVGLDRLREPAAFPGWLRRIVHNHCDRQLRRWREQALPEEVEVRTSPEAALDATGEWAELRRRLDALPEHERVVVAMHHLGGVPVRRIAAFLELAPGAVKTRLSRARGRLRSLEAPVLDPAPLRDAVTLFLAIHAGDRPAVREVATRRPDLLDREEAWTDDEALAGGFVLAHPRTPLMVAASLGHPGIVDDLLRLGADPDGRCSCDNGEPALWVAARFGHPTVVDALMRAGADPDAVHRSGVDLPALATWRTDPAASALTRIGDRLHTGLAAVDLWLAPHVHDLVRVTGAAETGLMVLLSELSHAFGAAGGQVVWTSWVPHPWHRHELEGVARRCGVERWVDVVTPATTDVAGPEDVLPTALARLGDPLSLHVVFEQPGHSVDLAAHLADLREHASLTLVVRPWGKVTAGVAGDDSWGRRRRRLAGHLAGARATRRVARHRPRGHAQPPRGPAPGGTRKRPSPPPARRAAHPAAAVPRRLPGHGLASRHLRRRGAPRAGRPMVSVADADPSAP
jgi:RNA polymerase sigma factor (sigma-70 family)